MAMAAIGLVSTSKSRASSKPAGEKTVKILLDTDIGSDIDDAVCLAYLLANPQCELLGITTVTGEAVKRAQMASALCKIAGKKVPIYPGAENPLLIAQRQTGAPQARQLSNWRHQTDFPKNDAVAFMRRTIRNNPGEIILLPVGPLTNVALLFANRSRDSQLTEGVGHNVRKIHRLPLAVGIDGVERDSRSPRHRRGFPQPSALPPDGWAGTLPSKSK